MQCGISSTFGYVEMTPVDLTGDVSAVYGIIIRWLLCLGMHLVTKKLQKYKRKESLQILQKHRSYTAIVAFVERETMLTFINKVRNLVLLS